MATTIGTLNQSLVSGQRKLTDLQSYQKVPQYIKLSKLWQGMAPLTVITQRAGMIKAVGDDNYFHLEKDELPQTVVATGSSHNSSVTTIVLATDEGRNIRVGDIIMVMTTGEQILVLGVSVDTITSCVRGHGGTTASTIPASARMQILAMTDTDGNTAPAGFQSTPKQKINYLQIEKEAIELSGRDMESELYGTDDARAEAWVDAISRLEQKVEKTLILGGLDAGSTANHRKTTGGLKHWISTNVVDASGGFTELVLNQWLELITRFNQSKSLLVFGGQNFCAQLDKFARDRIHYDTSDTVFGVDAMSYRSSFGQLKIVRHGMFNNSYDTTGTLAGYAFAVNLDKFKMAAFRNRSKMIKKAVQVGDLDGVKDYILHDFGAFLESERHHGFMYGIPALF